MNSLESAAVSAANKEGFVCESYSRGGFKNASGKQHYDIRAEFTCEDGSVTVSAMWDTDPNRESLEAFFISLLVGYKKRLQDET